MGNPKFLKGFDSSLLNSCSISSSACSTRGVKESIFCYWSYLYEDYLKNKKIENENTIQKAIITQIESPRNISSLLLTIDSKLNYCAEISLVELKKYFEKERWVEGLEINNSILFIAKKMY